MFWIVALHWVPGASAQSFDFSSLQFVVGTGTNESALVICWNESSITPDCLAWGYRWNMPTSGTAPTIYAMIQAIQAADPRFQTTANPEYDSPATGDYALYSVFFDLTGQGGTPVVGTPKNLGGQENGYPPYPGDLYREGWITKFWGEVVGTGYPYEGGSWNSGSTVAHGIAVDRISNNSWSGLSFSTDATYPYTIPNPTFPTAVSNPSGTEVPVPAWASNTCVLLLGAMGMLTLWKRRPNPAHDSR